MSGKRIKTSKINTMPKNELQLIINESSTMTEVLKKLEYDPFTGNHRRLSERIKRDNIDMSKFKENKKLIKHERKDKIKIEDLLVENGTYGRGSLKKRLIKEGLLEYKCDKCGNTGEWQGEKLSLQLEHKNGINDDNRLENLEILFES
jgi:hypothetical protein